MAVSELAMVELQRFVEALGEESSLKTVSTQQDLDTLLQTIKSPLASALIPMEQATRPPKILVDSGTTAIGLPWRIVQCPGGPLVLQMICDQVNFALWIQEC